MNAFMGEFLILSGTFKANMIIAGLSIIGVVLGAAYMIWLYYRVILNEINLKTKSMLSDLTSREVITLIPLVLLVFFIGVQPEALLSFMHVSVEHLLNQLHNSAPADSDQMYDMAIKLIERIRG